MIHRAPVVVNRQLHQAGNEVAWWEDPKATKSYALLN